MGDFVLDPVIATRVLESGDETVRVSIGMPRPFETGTAYFCPFEIVGPITNKRMRAGGFDAVQALSLALQMIGAVLLFTPERKAGKLTWLGRMDLGFPLSSVMEDLRDKIPDTP